MSEHEHPLSKWFGERKMVRLMLLAALLALSVMHIEFILDTALRLWQVASPLIVGMIFAYILEIIIKRFEKILFPNSKKKWMNQARRPICILLATLLVVFLAVLLVSIIIPGLTDAFTVLAREFPNYFLEVKGWVLETFSDVPTVTNYVKDLEVDWNFIQDRAVQWAINGIGDNSLLSNTVTVISAVTGSIANFLISAIFAIFLLTGKQKLQNQYRNLMWASVSEKNNNKLQRIMQTANRCFSGFIVGQSINGLILGVLTWLGMRIFSMPYALMVGVLSGTTSLIPIIGGYIGAALGTFLVFTANPGLALWFLVFIVALQTLQGNILYPRLVGDSVGLPSLWVLAAVSVGGGLGGVGGMLVAVPITATVYILVREWVQKKKEAAKIEEPAR
ncbi:MAG: AI-2E family transporter [Clostridia bacterium]|nr:AI-2E family transporter [Clostridia bacterium]